MFCKNQFKDKVKCKECKCWLDKYDAQVVSVQLGLYSTFKDEEYYCNTHRKPYKKVICRVDKDIFIEEIEVDKDGEPIGYKKIK